MSIRPATDDDHDSLQGLWHEFQQELVGPEWWDESWDEAWSVLRDRISGSGYVLLAEADGEVVGFASGGERRPRVLYVNDLFVRRAARRQGIAKELLGAVAEIARQSQAEVLMLAVDVDNADARMVYRRLGFGEQAVTLVAGIDTLERRVTTSSAPPSVASTHVQTDDVEAVERALAQFVPRKGRSAWSDVSPASNGWVAVIDELCDHDRDTQRRLALELSDRLGVPVVALAVEEDSVVRFLLYDRGRMVDEYLSVPTYYGELSRGDELALSANPTLVARLTGADPGRLRAVARVAPSPADLPPARELAVQIADAMQLEARIER